METTSYLRVSGSDADLDCNSLLPLHEPNSSSSSSSASHRPCSADSDTENDHEHASRRKSPAITQLDLLDPYQVVPGIHVAKETGSRLWLAFNLGTCLSLLAPLISLIVWLATTSNQKLHFNTFSANTPLGGHLTQGQAKTIDAVTGAVIVPLLMAALNYIWFASARVAVVNEAIGLLQKDRGVAFSAITRASTMSSGSFNVFHFHTMIQGKTWRLGMLVGLAVSSAIGSTSLSNVIAYEAFDGESKGSESRSLQLLRDPFLENMKCMEVSPIDCPHGDNVNAQASSAAGPIEDTPPILGFSRVQETKLMQEIPKVLDKIWFE